MNFKDEIVKRMAAGRDLELNFVANLSPADRAEVGTLARWSAKDNIAHIAYWRQRRVADFQKVVEGEALAEVDDLNHLNDSVLDEFRDVPWETVSALSAQAYAAIYDLVGRMSEEDLRLRLPGGDPLWQRILRNGYIHPIIHLSDYYQEHGDRGKRAELLLMLGQPLADLDDAPDWQGLARYNQACALALAGRSTQAIAELQAAFEFRPSLVELGKEDPDLASLREETGFQALFSD